MNKTDLKNKKTEGVSFRIFIFAINLKLAAAIKPAYKIHI